MIDFLKARVESNKKKSHIAILPHIIQFIESTREINTLHHKHKIEADIKTLKQMQCNKHSKALAEEIFYTKSFTYLHALKEAYEHETGTKFENLIKNVYGKTSSFIIRNLFLYANSSHEYFAYVIKTSTKGLLNNDILLRSVILMRCELDIKEIKQVYALKYGKKLKKLLCDNTSGYYKYAVYKLVGEQYLRHY